MAIGIPDSEADLLARWYREASDRMRQILLHPPGKTEEAKSWRRAWAAQKLTQIQKLLQDLDKKAAAEIGKGVSKAVATGVRQANAQLAKAGVLSRKSALMGDFSIIDHRQIRLIAQNTLQDVMKATDSMGKTAGRVLRQIQEYNLGEAEINKLIAGGLIDGMPREAIRTIRKELERVNNGQLVEVINKNGELMHFDSAQYARMVYVTKTSEAHVKSTHLRLQEENIDLVRIIGNRTQYFCTEYLGQIYSLSGTSKKYDPLASLPGGGPPFHPNCSKSTVAFIEELQ